MADIMLMLLKASPQLGDSGSGSIRVEGGQQSVKPELGNESSAEMTTR